MITRRQLARSLYGSSLSDWTIVERDQEIATVDRARELRRVERRVRTAVTAHVDQPAGRGSVRLDVAAHDDANQLVAAALRLATGAVGAAWRSPPSAAPAQVQVADPALAGQDLVEAAARAIELRSVPGVIATGSLELVRERVTVQSRSGFDAAWTATLARATVLVVAGEHSHVIVRTARRLDQLELAPAIVAAAADLNLLASAEPSKPGRCAVVLGTDALLHGDGAGVWEIFAAQADAVLERQGLTRYKLGAPIAEGATSVVPPLRIDSDGALDFGTRSAPVGDDGDAIRKFTIVERGVAVGLGLTAREAALRGKDPNGGVRNLVVPKGAWLGELPEGRTVELRRLRALAIDPYTGDASFEIALGIERTGGAMQPFHGGTLRLDLVRALASARRSEATVRRGSYAGPAMLLIEGVELT